MLQFALKSEQDRKFEKTLPEAKLIQAIISLNRDPFSPKDDNFFEVREVVNKTSSQKLGRCASHRKRSV